MVFQMFVYKPPIMYKYILEMIFVLNLQMKF